MKRKSIEKLKAALAEDIQSNISGSETRSGREHSLPETGLATKRPKLSNLAAGPSGASKGIEKTLNNYLIQDKQKKGSKAASKCGRRKWRL